ncbi:protein of unknown function [Taphrina deformans PYCC 5710]|uniref:Uncharacterized protein n=1 Tax=Taphrina deformans (strain PYCC 5710 / ATCC 11124 / CBS 356.35 / IMI 108563 / JCM 9778 / NBRC 8474) TaxID=1097556 RepID=R4XP96_TAPDE|nr:protein of unknown function [Taphrina deformans PYCC 5710]|eukprot:CCG85070.1 protein of unknown function [Taphrina deformans PYCC 5710]
MQSFIIPAIVFAASAFALPGLRVPQHHHHAKRDDVIVYATVQVTQYITMTAGQSETSTPHSAAGVILNTAGNVAYAAAKVQSTESDSQSTTNVPTTLSTRASPTTTTSNTPTPISTTAQAATTSAGTPKSSSSGTKRGLAWASSNPSSMVSMFSTSALGWYFNWGTSTVRSAKEVVRADEEARHVVR